MATLTAETVRRAEKPASEFVPFSHLVTPTIMATRGAEYLSTWRIGGRSYETTSEDELARRVEDLNNVWRSIADAGVAFWSHVVRRRVEGRVGGKFENFFCRRLDEAYATTLRECRFMANELYLTLILKTVGDEVLELLGRFEKETVETKLARQAAGVAKLEEMNGILRGALKRYDAELLGTYEGEGGRLFSAALEALAQLVNGERLKMPVCRGRFAEYVVANRPFFSRHGEVGEIRLPDRVLRFGMLEIAEYDGTGTAPGELNDLLKSDFEFVLTQSWSALSKHAARGFLQRHKQRLLDAKDVARSQIAEMDAVQDQLMSGRFAMGEHHATLLVLGETVEEVRAHIAWARSELLDRGLVAKPLDLALEAGFWAQLPGNWRWRPRPMAITSQNFLCFSPFHNFMSGKAAGNPWGPAVTLLRTASGTPLYFSFHASPEEEDSEGKRLVGNTVVLGQTGGGKTVVISFLLAQAQKFHPTVVVFDVGRGMEIALRAMGGRYFPLRRGECTGWNPFQLEAVPGNVLFLKALVKELVVAGGHAATHRDEQEIDGAVNTLMTLIDPKDRRLSVLLQFLPDPVKESDTHPSVAARLLKWCEGGQYGWVFDNPTDLLDLTTHRVYGFDVGEFLENAEARGPMMKYLIFRTKAMLDGRRFILVFDEWWKALSGEDFAELTRTEAKTIRKKDGFLIVSTQEPDDALRHPVGKSTIEQSATLVLMRNPKATRGDYLDGLKLTEREYELVRAFPEDSRQFLVKQGANSVVAQLDLSGLGAELAVLSGTPDRARIAEDMVARLGEEPEAWLPAFWARLGVRS